MQEGQPTKRKKANSAEPAALPASRGIPSHRKSGTPAVAGARHLEPAHLPALPIS